MKNNVFFKNEALTHVRLHPTNTIKPRKKTEKKTVNHPLTDDGIIDNGHNTILFSFNNCIDNKAFKNQSN